MHRKSLVSTSLLTLAACACLALGALTARAADASGTWTWSRPGRNGGEAQKMTLVLKAEGEKLSGSVTSPGRQGGDPVKTEITEGKVKEGEVSFAVTREMNGNKMTTKYTGKVEGDTLKGKTEHERNGEKMSRDWEAKREKK